ncbi:MAG: PP2C family protein-serine/threonine phosphatase [Blastocatellia bacterium]
MPVKILVVDDEPDLELLVRQKFRRQIRDKAFEFTFALNGAEALEHLRTDPEIDLIMTDINMPVMDGLTLVSKVADVSPTLKAIVVSAYGDMENIRAAMNRGAYDFLTKPIDFDDLDLTLDKTVKRVRYLKQSQVEHDQLLAIQQELAVATRIQKAILPCDFPPFPNVNGFDLFAEMIPAREVGGDFYDFFLLDPDRLGLAIGDVSDKGVPAAIFMAVTRTLLKSVALTGISPGECLRLVNRLLTIENTSCMFVTLFYGILNIRTGELQYTNAGHNPPYLTGRPEGVCMLDAPPHVVLGIDENAAYETLSIKLAPGDGMLLYTDGITEAFNVRQEMFTERRLKECLERAPRFSSRELTRAVVKEVRQFIGGAPQSDDLTMLAVRHGV